MPFSIGNSDNWPDVCAHRIGAPLSRMTAELPRDTEQDSRGLRSTERSMAAELGLQTEMEPRGATLD